MAHFGVGAGDFVKALSAAAYWKEWSCAIPFTSAGWAAGEHELEKTTFPRPSEDHWADGSLLGLARGNGAKTIKTSKNLRGNIRNHLRIVPNTEFDPVFPHK